MLTAPSRSRTLSSSKCRINQWALRPTMSAQNHQYDATLKESGRASGAVRALFCPRERRAGERLRAHVSAACVARNPDTNAAQCCPDCGKDWYRVGTWDCIDCGAEFCQNCGTKHFHPSYFDVGGDSDGNTSCDSSDFAYCKECASRTHLDTHNALQGCAPDAIANFQCLNKELE